jgi:hypothetical protein
MHPFHSLIITLTDTPVDLSTETATITTVLGGLGAALGLVIAGALAIKAVTWGVPKIVRFFTRLAG